MAFKIIQLKGNPQGYRYNVQIWDYDSREGKSYYTGKGKFFKTKKDAELYMKLKRSRK